MLQGGFSAHSMLHKTSLTSRDMPYCAGECLLFREHLNFFSSPQLYRRTMAFSSKVAQAFPEYPALHK